MYINCVALWTLGITLFGQTLLGLWCYLSNLRAMPKGFWSANPLSTTMTVLDSSHKGVRHRTGRCMVTIQSRNDSESAPCPCRPSLRHRRTTVHCMACAEFVPCRPSLRQPSQLQTRPTVKWIVLFSWLLPLLALVGFLITLFLSRNQQEVTTPALSGYMPWNFSLSWWNWLDGSGGIQNILVVAISPSCGNYYANDIQFTFQQIFGILFMSALQGLQSIGTHCAELVVNISRDEGTWRQLDAFKAKDLKYGVLDTAPWTSAALNWKYLTLFLFKALLHWVLGQSIISTFDAMFIATEDDSSKYWYTCLEFEILYSRLFIYIILNIAFAIFVTVLTAWKPKGPQPATWGHIQTLADLVDDWTTDEKGRFWWGDKGDMVDGVRHAGTSAKREMLGEIDMRASYA